MKLVGRPVCRNSALTNHYKFKHGFLPATAAPGRSTARVRVARRGPVGSKSRLYKHRSQKHVLAGLRAMGACPTTCSLL